MPEAVVTQRRRRISAIWLVPLAAVAIGAWMVIHTYLTQGPEVAITFATAEGIEVGKTKIKLRAVAIGLVETVELGEDLATVTVRARLDPGTRTLLREDTQFWVVRPRFGRSGLSGLGTVLSGAYIEVAPGAGAEGRRTFRGLDDMPVTPPTTAGLHVTLVSPDTAGLGAGNPVLYRGYTVGRVESATLDLKTKRSNYRLFIEAPYDDLVTSNSRFWNASGISVDLGADGLAVKTESLEALLMGGVAFDIPDGSEPGTRVERFTEFELFADHASIGRHPATYHLDYVLLFDTSVRGLLAGAPVEYRGIRVGSVEQVPFLEAGSAILGSAAQAAIPVRIRLDPVRFDLSDTVAGRTELATMLAERVQAGLRASLKSGSLVTGRLFVALDIVDDVKPAAVREAGGHTFFPTESSGLEQIELKVAALLDKLQQLPLDTTLASARGTLDAVTTTVATANDTLRDLNVILAQDATKRLPAALDGTMTALSRTLEGLAPGSVLYEDLQEAVAGLSASLSGLEQLLATLNARPSALVLSGSQGPDPEPEVRP
jgi:paraquat-inducible protein B